MRSSTALLRYLLISERLFWQTYGDGSELCERQFLQRDFSSLKDCPFVLRNINDITRQVGLGVFKRAGIERPKIKAKSSNLETLLSLCAIGVGACFCPENFAKSILSENQFDSLKIFSLGDDASYQLRFALLVRSYQWSVIKTFMQQAVDYVSTK